MAIKMSDMMDRLIGIRSELGRENYGHAKVRTDNLIELLNSGGLIAHVKMEVGKDESPD